MAVRHRENGKLEYFRDGTIRYIRKFWLLDEPFPGKDRNEEYKPEHNLYEGRSCSSSSISPWEGEDEDIEHSCSPQECPTCKDKSCPNRYDEFIEEGEMEI